MSAQSASLALADELASSPFAWPGGYQRFALTSDGAALCSHCCAAERERIGSSSPSDGWHVVALEINWEDELSCDHCSSPIPSSY